MLACILEGVRQPVSDLIPHGSREAYPTRLGQALQACRHIYSIAEEVVLIVDHIAEIDADPEQNAPVLAQVGIPVEHAPLHLDGTAHRLDRTGELDQKTVAGRFDDVPTMLTDQGIDKLPAQCP